MTECCIMFYSILVSSVHTLPYDAIVIFCLVWYHAVYGSIAFRFHAALCHAKVKGWWRKGPRFDHRFAEIRSLAVEPGSCSDLAVQKVAVGLPGGMCFFFFFSVCCFVFCCFMVSLSWGLLCIRGLCACNSGVTLQDTLADRIQFLLPFLYESLHVGRHATDFFFRASLSTAVAATSPL